MEFTGNLIRLAKDFETGKFQLTLQINEPSVAAWYEKEKGTDILKIAVSKFRKKRSIDANNYMWELLFKMAPILHTSKDELYLVMLEKYGTFFYLPALDRDLEDLRLAFRIVRLRGKITLTTQSGKVVEANQCQCYKGSSLYDTKEMSHLIDGIVSDAQELGIETMTPAEIEEMKQRWNLEVSTAGK